MSKRNYNGLKLCQKVNITKDVDPQRINKEKLAEKYGISHSTLNTLFNNRDIDNGGIPPDRKRLRTAKHENLETKLFEFFVEVRAANLPITGPLLREKANQLATEMNIVNFNGSNGWLWRFQKRFNVSLQTVKSAPKVESSVLQAWLDIMQNTVTKYSHEDIYNLVEMNIFLYCSEPTLASKKRKKDKSKRETLTILLCCNMNGTEKLKPLIIGKFPKPESIEEAGVEELPVTYVYDEKAHLTESILREWLIAFQKRMEKENRKVLLALDNTSAFNIINLSLPNVKLLFFPANGNSIIKPIGGNIIHKIKTHYKKCLTDNYMQYIKDGLNEEEIKKRITLDSMVNVSLSWNAVSPDTIAECFQRSIMVVANPVFVYEADRNDSDCDYVDLELFNNNVKKTLQDTNKNRDETDDNSSTSQLPENTS